jgi:hypothetical protein
MSDDCTNWSNTRKKATCINSANVGWHWHARGPRGRGLGSEKTTPGSIRLAVAARLGSGASGDGGIDPLHAASWPGSCGARVPLHLPREDGTSDPTDRGDARSCTSSGPTRAHLNHSRYRTTCFPGVPPQPKHGTGRDGYHGRFLARRIPLQACLAVFPGLRCCFNLGVLFALLRRNDDIGPPCTVVFPSTVV